MAKNYIPKCDTNNDTYTYSELKSDFPGGVIQAIGDLPPLDPNNSFEDVGKSWDIDMKWLKEKITLLKKNKLIPELIPPVVPTFPILPPLPQPPILPSAPTQTNNPSMPNKPSPTVYPKPKAMTKKKESNGVENVSYIQLGYGPTVINLSQLVGLDSNGVNVTKGRRVKGTSTYSFGVFSGKPEIAVDGNEKPRDWPYGIYHSNVESGGDVFEVTLDEPTTISQVLVYNRTSIPERMKGHVIKLLDANKNVLWTSSPLTAELTQTLRAKSLSTTSNKPSFDNYKVYRPGDIISVNGVDYIMTNYIGAAGYSPLGYPANWKVYIPPINVDPSDCGTFGSPSSDNSLRLYKQEECTNGLKGSWAESSICYQDSTNDFESSYSTQCAYLNKPDPTKVQYDSDMKSYNDTITRNQEIYNNALTAFNEQVNRLQNAYQTAMDNYESILNQINALVRDYNNKANKFNDTNNKYRKFISDQYCFYNNMLRYANSNLSKSISDLDVRSKTPAVNNNFNLVQNLNYKLVILQEIAEITFVDNVKLLSKNIPPVLEGFRMEGFAGSTSEDINNQYNILTRETKREEKNKRLIEYTIEKNNANQNLLTLFGVLNVVALGIIYAIANT